MYGLGMVVDHVVHVLGLNSAIDERQVNESCCVEVLVVGGGEERKIWE